MSRVALLFGLAAATAGLAPSAAAASAATPTCASPVRTVRLRLPAPLRLTTPCATYTVSRPGVVTAAVTPRLRTQGVSWMAVAGAGAPIAQQGARIAVLAHGSVWRSRGRFRAAGVFATLGRRVIAFSYQRFTKRGERTSLYLAPFGRSERRVALNEQPLGWIGGGELLTWRYAGSISLYVRDHNGRLLQRVGRRLREIRFDQATRSVLAVSRDERLLRYRAGRWSRLATLKSLGLDRHTSFERLSGGLIGLVDRHQVVVLRQDGSVFGSARFRSGDVAGESGLVANAAGTAVAFVVSHGSPAAGRGRESVQVLRGSAHHATTLHTGAVPGALCVRWATLAWHRNWLLYSVTGGKTLLLDTAARGKPLDLTGLVAALVPHGNLRSIAWA